MKPIAGPISSSDASKQKKDAVSSEQLSGGSALFAIGQTNGETQSPKKGRASRGKGKGKEKVTDVTFDDYMDVDTVV